MQRAQQIKAIHQQNDPQMKAILSPEQYQKLQAKQELEKRRLAETTQLG